MFRCVAILSCRHREGGDGVGWLWARGQCPIPTRPEFWYAFSLPWAPSSTSLTALVTVGQLPQDVLYRASASWWDLHPWLWRPRAQRSSWDSLRLAPWFGEQCLSSMAMCHLLPGIPFLFCGGPSLGVSFRLDLWMVNFLALLV